jgi:asparagine synthase (glutamine-hydrolysing)
MCGVCGIVSFEVDEQIDQPALARMCQALRHRGPDDEGYYLDEQAGLGMRRLSIIDLDTGRQPISDETQSLWIVFNGEIYNYRALRAELERRGHVFKTQSDTEVIVHAYEEYGRDCVGHFIGMFAIAIWDKARRSLFLVRDRLGIKPLYYWSSGKRLVFGSELKALLESPHVPREVDHLALDQYLTLEYIPSPRTIFQEVRKLPPGHWLTFDEHGVRVEPYWDVSRVSLPADERACAEQLTELIDDAVRLRLVSDVPLGAFLSGGIDSSTVVAAMQQAGAAPIRTFSIGFDDATYDELPYARLVARTFGTDHSEEILKPDISSLAEELIGHLDEPFADFSIFPTYLVSRLARQSVKVVLSGDGGDEIFGGYDTYVAQRLDRTYKRLPRPLRQRALPALLDRVPPQRAKKGLINKTKRFVEGAALPEEWGHTRWMMFLTPADRRALYQPDMQMAVSGRTAAAALEQYYAQAGSFDDLARQQYVDIKSYLADDILTKVDRMSMAVSLEARVPLLDHRLVEFALNLPPHLKLNRGQTKVILRRAMARRLPAEVLNKPKQGFSIPIKHWLRGPLRPLMHDLLSPAAIGRHGYFQPATVARWMAEHLNGQANHSHRLWGLMVFELWHRQVMDRRRVA